MRRTAMVLAALGLGFALSVTTASAGVARHQLTTHLPELKFQSATLGDAIDFLRDVSGANITVNWKALAADGITRDTPVNLHLTRVTLRKSLDLLLSEAGGGDAITYVVDQGVIEITTRQLADRMLVTRVYPVEDLLMVIPDFTDVPQFSLEASSQNSGQTSGPGMGGTPQVTNRLFVNGGNRPKAEAVKSKAQRARDLVDLIEAVVFPDIWKDNGGTASIRYFNGMLVVTAPRSVQEAIGGDYN